MAAPPVAGPAFLHLVAHDLRAPVAAVRTMVSLLSQGHVGVIPAPQADLIGRIEHRLESLQALLDDLIDLAALRASPETGGTADLGGAAQDACAHLEGRARASGSRLCVQAPEAAVRAAITPADLDLALTHLLTNSIKYGRGRPILVRVHSQADGARLAVSDEGIGICGAARARLFQPMFRAAEAEAIAAGSGLGLLIVKEAVERAGGSVEIDSTEGVGTTVTLCLPAAVGS
jgi:signal transduction histidine kinase